MGGCVGGLSKSLPAVTTERRSRRHSSRRGGSGSFELSKYWWSSSPGGMEDNDGKSHSVQKNSPVCALILWNERRKEWRGNRSGNISRSRLQMPREPPMSWSTNYDDLLATNRPFPQPIPLAEMVDFLVDIWEEEGLYDSL